jgi:DNA modification methylase
LANEFDLNLKEWEFEPLVFDNKLEASEDDYEVTEAEAIQTNIVLGDLIEFKKDGKTLHRLMCGDSTDSEQVAKLMNGNKADISIQSPPYNVGRTPNGNKQKYKNDSDNKSITDYLALIEQATKNAIINSIFSFINIQPLSGNKLSIIEYLFILKEWFCDYIIWDKMQAEPAMGENILNSRFEFIYVFGENATRRIGVKKFRGTLDNMIFIKSRQDKEYSDIHKATYPIALAAYLIENFSVQSCLDLFCGSGTTMVAAHQLQRKCYGMEIDPIYCQVIIDRMLKLDSNLEVIINGEQYK